MVSNRNRIFCNIHSSFHFIKDQWRREETWASFHLFLLFLPHCLPLSLSRFYFFWIRIRWFSDSEVLNLGTKNTQNRTRFKCEAETTSWRHLRLFYSFSALSRFFLSSFVRVLFLQVLSLYGMEFHILTFGSSFSSFNHLSPLVTFSLLFVSIALRRRIYFLLSLLISNPFYLDYDFSEKNKKEEMILLPFPPAFSIFSHCSYISILTLNLNRYSLQSSLSTIFVREKLVSFFLSLSPTQTHTLVPLPLLEEKIVT